MNSPDTRIHFCQFHTDAETAEMMVELLATLDLQAVTDHDARTGLVSLRVYGESQDEIAAAEASIRAALPGWADLLPGEVVCLGLDSLQREDWAESWKVHFKVLRPSPRLVIRPSWEPVAAEDGVEIITLDPGMSFGTGQHPTTRACLALLDELRDRFPEPPGFLDVGCGSGILSIAAARLGYAPVVAFDHDQQCIQATQENAVTNDVADAIDLQCIDLADWDRPQPFAVVAANLFAHVLIANAATIAGCLPKEGPAFLMVAGILNEQYEDVLGAFAEFGLAEIRRVAGEEWTSGCLARGL